jgi:hypothetical protein
VRRALALVVALTVLPGVARAGAAAPILADDAYRFCHEPNYRLTQSEHRWCPVVAEQDESTDCPALPEACRAEPVEEEELSWLPRSGSGDGRREPEKPPPEPFKLEIPNLGVLGKIAFVVLLAIGAVLVGKALRDHLSRARERERDDDEPAPEQPVAAAAPALGPVETDVARLLARARAAAARGDFEAALEDAYAALLRRLDGDGLIAIHPSSTNGDYLRTLRARPDLRPAVAEIFRDVERVQFGAAPATPGLFQAVFERVVPIATRAAGVLALALALGAGLSCGGGAAPPRTEATRDTSPSGTRAVIALLEQEGVDARARRKPLTSLEGEERTLVLLRGVTLDDDEWKSVLEWVREGHTLIVAGPVFLPEEVGVDVVRARGESGLWLTPAGDYEDSLGALDLASPEDGAVTLKSDAASPLLFRDEEVYAARARLDEGTVLVFGDGRLFTNIALAQADDARFLAELFRLFPGDVELCDLWTGAGASTPMEAVANAKLTPLVLQLLAALALYVLWKGRSFGVPRDPASASRRAFADHVRALGAAYSRARASQHVAGLYAAWAIERLRDRMHGGQKRGLVALAEAVARRTGRPEPEVMRVLVEAQGVGEEAAPPSFRASGPPSGRRAPTPSDAGDSLALVRELDRYLAVAQVHPQKPRPAVLTEKPDRPS